MCVCVCVLIRKKPMFLSQVFLLRHAMLCLLYSIDTFLKSKSSVPYISIIQYPSSTRRLLLPPRPPANLHQPARPAAVLVRQPDVRVQRPLGDGRDVEVRVPAGGVHFDARPRNHGRVVGAQRRRRRDNLVDPGAATTAVG